MPAVSTAMSTSCGPGLGTGTSCRVRADGGPNRSNAAAFMVSGIPRGDPLVVLETRRSSINKSQRSLWFESPGGYQRLFAFTGSLGHHLQFVTLLLFLS